MYTDPTLCSAGAHVASSSQSNGGSPEREPTRTGSPRSSSRSTTLRPVLPVPPRTSVVVFLCPFSIIFSFDAVGSTLPGNLRPGRVERHPPKGGSGGRRSACSGYHRPPGQRIRQTPGGLRNQGIRLEQSQLPGPRDGLCAVAHIELAVNIVYVGLDRAQGDEQIFGDLPVGFSGRDESEYLHLPLAQGLGEPRRGRRSTGRVVVDRRQEPPEVVRGHHWRERSPSLGFEHLG